MAGNARRPAVSVTVALLKAALDGVRVVSEVPRSRPSTFVRVVRVGGVKANLVTDGPTMVVECWAPNSVAAESLSGLVADVLEQSPSQFVEYIDEGGQTRKAWITSHDEVSGPQSFDDPDVPDQSRWQLTVQLGIATNI